MSSAINVEYLIGGFLFELKFIHREADAPLNMLAGLIERPG